MSGLAALLVPWLLLAQVHSFGNMPDASQEGILKQFGSYEDVALFHYNVPPDVSRASWEFASFQNDPECEVREVEIWLQHGSFPVMSPHNSSFPANMMRLRTGLHMVRAVSAYNPHDSTILPVYDPLPGTWYAAAYLIPFEEKIIQQGIHQKCRYSLGSIALWSRADSVELVSPLTKQTVVTKKQRTPNTNSASDCIVLGRVSTTGSSAVQCKVYTDADLRWAVSPTSRTRGPTATSSTTSCWSSASSTTMTQSPGVEMPEKKVQERKPSVTEPVVQSVTSAGSNGGSSRKRKVSFMIHYQPQLKAILSIQTQVLKVFIINNSGKPN